MWAPPYAMYKSTPKQTSCSCICDASTNIFAAGCWTWGTKQLQKVKNSIQFLASSLQVYLVFQKCSLKGVEIKKTKKFSCNVQNSSRKSDLIKKICFSSLNLEEDSNIHTVSLENKQILLKSCLLCSCLKFLQHKRDFIMLLASMNSPEMRMNHFIA